MSREFTWLLVGAITTAVFVDNVIIRHDLREAQHTVENLYAFSYRYQRVNDICITAVDSCVSELDSLRPRKYRVIVMSDEVVQTRRKPQKGKGSRTPITLTRVVDAVAGADIP